MTHPSLRREDIPTHTRLDAEVPAGTLTRDPARQRDLGAVLRRYMWPVCALFRRPHARGVIIPGRGGRGVFVTTPERFWEALTSGQLLLTLDPVTQLAVSLASPSGAVDQTSLSDLRYRCRVLDARIVASEPRTVIEDNLFLTIEDVESWLLGHIDRYEVQPGREPPRLGPPSSSGPTDQESPDPPTAPAAPTDSAVVSRYDRVIDLGE